MSATKSLVGNVKKEKKRNNFEEIKQFSQVYDASLLQREYPRRTVTHFESPEKRKMRILNEKLIKEEQSSSFV